MDAVCAAGGIVVPGTEGAETLTDTAGPVETVAVMPELDPVLTVAEADTPVPTPTFAET